jgi:hypothetical protein
LVRGSVFQEILIGEAMRHRTLITSVILATVAAQPSFAKDVVASIEDKSLSSADAAIFLVLGLQDGAQFGSQGPTVKRVGAELTSNVPYGFEIMDGRLGPSEIVSAKENTPCTYTMSISSYPASRELNPTLKPRVVSFDLDFSKAVGATVVVGERRTSSIAGLQCKSVQDAEGHCSSIQNAGLVTAASGSDLLKVFAYFQDNFCPRQ